MKFAKLVFFWSGVYGLMVLIPMLFLETEMGIWAPPASNRPEQYYAFLTVALSWQFVFLIIAHDPLRFRLLMLPAILEKIAPSFTVLLLYLEGRVAIMTVIPFFIDMVMAVLFMVSFLCCRNKTI